MYKSKTFKKGASFEDPAEWLVLDRINDKYSTEMTKKDIKIP